MSLTTPHTFAPILRALIQGKEIQARHRMGGPWAHLNSVVYQNQSCAYEALVNGWDANWEYRVKPEMMQVNGRSVPKPLTSAPKEGAECFLLDLTNQEPAQPFTWQNVPAHIGWLGRGLVYSCRQDCRERADAILSIEF